MADHISTGTAILGAHKTITAAQEEAKKIVAPDIRTVSVYATQPDIKFGEPSAIDSALFFNVAVGYRCPCCGHKVETLAP